MRASASLHAAPDYLRLRSGRLERQLSPSPKTDLGEDTGNIHLLSLDSSAATGHDYDGRSPLFYFFFPHQSLLSRFPFRARTCCAPTHKLGCAERPCSTQSGAAYLRGPVIAAAALRTHGPTIFAEEHTCLPHFSSTASGSRLTKATPYL